jgi:PhnB protein
MPALNPYLNFNSNAEEAFNFYKSVFGGEFAMIMRFSDVPPGMPMGEGESNKIMHVALPIIRHHIRRHQCVHLHQRRQQGTGR